MTLQCFVQSLFLLFFEIVLRPKVSSRPSRACLRPSPPVWSGSGLRFDSHVSGTSEANTWRQCSQSPSAHARTWTRWAAYIVRLRAESDRQTHVSGHGLGQVLKAFSDACHSLKMSLEDEQLWPKRTNPCADALGRRRWSET